MVLKRWFTVWTINVLTHLFFIKLTPFSLGYYLQPKIFQKSRKNPITFELHSFKNILFRFKIIYFLNLVTNYKSNPKLEEKDFFRIHKISTVSDWLDLIEFSILTNYIKVCFSDYSISISYGLTINPFCYTNKRFEKS